MKANEIMNLDWVMKIDFDNNPVAPYQIDWIRTGEVGLFWNIITTPILIAPIPLTAEILEKNGFSIYPYYKKWVSSLENIAIYVRNNGVEVTINVYQDDEETYSLPPIDYVHQLQHALRLCGLNELADNFKI